MARPLRIEYPGAVYHVTARGNARQRIYADDTDFRAFLALLGKLAERYHWLCHAYCLMSNHYHLLLETPEGNLAAGMRQLNGIYTQAFNRRHCKVGHVFQGRYHAILVDKDRYVLELARYIVLNPVRARMVKAVNAYPWSSYRVTAGTGSGPDWLDSEWLLSQFHRQRSRAQDRYREFVRAGQERPGPWEQVTGQIFLGDDEFVRDARRQARGRNLKEIPRRQRFAGRPALKTLFAAGTKRTKTQRNALIQCAHREHGYTLVAIANTLGLHYTT
ncbi:MAG: REP-associated tyrosine transposase, partial [Gammaproteobacteria bacterium]